MIEAITGCPRHVSRSRTLGKFIASHSSLAQAVILCVQPPYWIGLAAPVICSLTLGISLNDINGWWLGWLLLPFSIGYTWLLARAIVGVDYKGGPVPATGA